MTVMSNFGFHRAMAEAGIEVATTPVGDRNVAAELERRRWTLGGEQSGHIIWEELGPTGDGIAAALLTMRALGGAELAEAIPMQKLPQLLENIEVADRGAVGRSERVREAVERESAELEGRGRVLVRPSGTEALVRVMVEAPTEEECRELDGEAHDADPRRARIALPFRSPVCGIVGYVGKRPCRDLLIAGLEKLEYRGYDSAGISLLENGRIDSVRAVGNLANLREAVGLDAAGGNGDGGVAVAAPPATIGLAHTRWATHGRVTEENAHPHGDCDDDVQIVANGIVENHAELRRELELEGHRFSSETDAEIVAHLIERHYDGDLTDAVRAAFGELRGHYAFAAMHRAHPDTLVAARQECPLVVGIGDGEASWHRRSRHSSPRRGACSRSRTARSSR